MNPTFVYFIKPKGRKGPIKIGCSNAPADRLMALGATSIGVLIGMMVSMS